MKGSSRKRVGFNSKKLGVVALIIAALAGAGTICYIIISDALVTMKEVKIQDELLQQQTDLVNKQSYDENYLFAGINDETTADNQAEDASQDASRGQTSDNNDLSGGDDLTNDSENNQNSVSEILASGKYPQVSIGIVEYGEVTAANAIQYSLPRGIIIFKTKEGSVARELGLKYGDVITKINDNKILYDIDVKKALSEGYGKDIVMEVFRGDAVYLLTLTVEMQEKCAVTLTDDSALAE